MSPGSTSSNPDFARNNILLVADARRAGRGRWLSVQLRRHRLSPRGRRGAGCHPRAVAARRSLLGRSLQTATATIRVPRPENSVRNRRSRACRQAVRPREAIARVSGSTAAGTSVAWSGLDAPYGRAPACRSRTSPTCSTTSSSKDFPLHALHPQPALLSRDRHRCGIRSARRRW